MPGLTRPVVTVVIPTFNECENLPRIVREVVELDVRHLNIVVVDVNSPDGTGDVADVLANRAGVAHDRPATNVLAVTGIMVASAVRFLAYRGAVCRGAPPTPTPRNVEASVHSHPPGITLVLTPFAVLTYWMSDWHAFSVATLAFCVLGALNAVLVVSVCGGFGFLPGHPVWPACFVVCAPFFFTGLSGMFASIVTEQFGRAERVSSMTRRIHSLTTLPVSLPGENRTQNRTGWDRELADYLRSGDAVSLSVTPVSKGMGRPVERDGLVSRAAASSTGGKGASR